MKYLFISLTLAALLAGCAVAPAGDDSDRERDYNHDPGTHRDYNDGNYRHYGYRGDDRIQEDRYRDYDSDC